MELISRDEVMRLVESGKLLSGSFGERAKDIIKALPIIEERKEGEWIPMTVSSGRNSWKCSVCGRRARGKIKNLPYCHCGAKMKGAK